jgi:hypothetical protein
VTHMQHVKEINVGWACSRAGEMCVQHFVNKCYGMMPHEVQKRLMGRKY